MDQLNMTTSCQEAESHVPALKNQGKSDCAVWIIDIADVDFDIPKEQLVSLQIGEFWTSPDIDSILLEARSMNQASSLDTSLAIKRSRTLDAQKVLKQPTFPKRISSNLLDHCRPHVNGIIYQYPQHIDIKRITSQLWAVRKQAFAGAKQDGARLLKQIEKQILYSAKCRTGAVPNVSVPEVYSIKLSEYKSVSTLSMDMEYIPFNDAKTIMMEKDKATNEWMIDAAIDIVNYNFSQSTLVELAEILPNFEKKAMNIKLALKTSKIISVSEQQTVYNQLDSILSFYKEKGDIQVPMGLCHGDLTLANMLIHPDNRELCVFDFLDCFVESPLQDIAKLLQDARHQWFMTQIIFSKDSQARVASLLDMFHRKIVDAYQEYDFWAALPLFEYLCLARILPYISSAEEKSCVLKGLSAIETGIHPAALLPTPLSAVAENPGQKITIIVPALGSDMNTEYSSNAPKLLALTSNGRPVIVSCIAELKVQQVSRIIIVVLKNLIKTYCGSIHSFERFFDVLQDEIVDKLEFIYSDRQSNDTCETIVWAIQQSNIKGPIFIKDADGCFKADEIFNGNYIHFANVVREETKTSRHAWSHLRPDLVDAISKAYVSFMYDNLICNISYGSLNSSKFCCGGFSFRSAIEFLQTVKQLRELLPKSSLIKLKVIDVVWHLVCQDHLFFGIQAHDFQDWGSNAAWLASLRACL